MMESLRNKVAVITGASAGIGEGTALLFAKHGCWLTLTGRDQERLSAVVQKCIAAGCPADKIVTVMGDVRDKSFQQEILDKTVSTFGHVDILVNNAGMVRPCKVTVVTEEVYDEIMNVNMKAIFMLTKLLSPEIIKTKGSIINVSSFGSQRPMPVYGVYCMSKAALDMFTQCLALELGPHGVRVNAVNPGVVVTMVAKRGPDAITDEEYAKFVKVVRDLNPLRTVGVPEDVANTIAFLASDMSRFVSGTTVFIDGAHHCASSGVPQVNSEEQKQ